MSESFIPLCVPKVEGNEWEYVKECLDTEWLSYVGSYVGKFEQELAAVVGAKHAVVTTSGTSALHCSLIVAGVKAGDEVVMPGLTFVAPANAVKYCGAIPTFVDVCEDTWQWDLSKLKDFLENHCEGRAEGLFNLATGRRIAALMPVHLLGALCDRKQLAAIAARYHLPLVEDSAEALGASSHEKGIGYRFASGFNTVCTSFNGNKIMTTGGGGAVFTDNDDVAQRIKHLSTTAKTDVVEFVHDEVGYNYRMTNVAAAIGCAQLENLSDYVSKKRQIAAAYREGLKGLPLSILPDPAGGESSYWLFTVRLTENSRKLLQFLADRKIQTRPLWMPMFDLNYLNDGYTHSAVVTKEMVDQCLSLPCSVGLTDTEQDRVIKSIVEYFSQC